MPKKIFLTVSSGNLGQKLLNQKTNFEILAPSSLEVNIFKLNDIETYLKKINHDIYCITQAYQTL